jgi:hypothetical protein
MRDFDAVLERLLTEENFQRAVAADPAAALRGYELTAEERQLLHSQFDLGPGEERTVEMRANKSGVIGLLGPVAAAFGVAAVPGGGVTGAGSGQALGSAPLASESFGASGDGHQEVMGAASSHQSLGSAPTDSPESLGSSPVRATGYHTRVDVNGDGTWDRHVDYERDDGGVDIHVDMNHDGVADFIGHDVDRDGLVDSADYDRNFDGVMDVRMYDDTGDGWLDRREKLPQPTKDSGPSESFGPASS